MIAAVVLIELFDHFSIMNSNKVRKMMLDDDCHCWALGGATASNLLRFLYQSTDMAHQSVYDEISFRISRMKDEKWLLARASILHRCPIHSLSAEL